MNLVSVPQDASKRTIEQSRGFDKRSTHMVLLLVVGGGGWRVEGGACDGAKPQSETPVVSGFKAAENGESVKRQIVTDR